MYKEIIIRIRKNKIKISINFKKVHRVKEFYKVKNKKCSIKDYMDEPRVNILFVAININRIISFSIKNKYFRLDHDKLNFVL